MNAPKDLRFAFAILDREREGGEYAKLVLISEKATELNEQRKEEERSSPPPQHHADSVRRAAGRHGQLQAQKEEREREGGTGCTGPMKLF